MKNLYLFSLILIIFNLLSCSPHEKKEESQVEVVTIKVNSIVCEICAKNVENAVGALDGIEGVKVDVEKKTATVTFLPTRVELVTIESSIIQAGYDANDKKANPEAYEKLDACCKIDG